MEPLILVRSGGNIASGIIYRLTRAGYKVVVNELPIPKMLRREASYGAAVHRGEMVLERIRSRHVFLPEVKKTLDEYVVPVVTEPYEKVLDVLQPMVVVDSIHANKNLGTSIDDAPLVIAVGAGFDASEDVDVVVEATRSYNMGRCIYDGKALSEKAAAARTKKSNRERIMYAPCDGLFTARRYIGEEVEKNEVIGYIDETPIKAEISGILRGALKSGLLVSKGDKILDIDHELNEIDCFSLSDRALAIGGGVVEAVRSWELALDTKMQGE